MPHALAQQSVLGTAAAISSRDSSSSMSRSAALRLLISRICGASNRSRVSTRLGASIFIHLLLFGFDRLQVNEADVGPAVSVGDRGRHLEPRLELFDVEVGSIETRDLARFQEIQPFLRLQFLLSHPTHLLVTRRRTRGLRA